MRPSPRHFLHGDATMRPSPRHVGHGATVTNWPKNDRCARRTSPLPLHVAHVCGFEPGSAPLPSQRSHGSSSLRLIFFSTPRRDFRERERHRDLDVRAGARTTAARASAEQLLEAAEAAEVAHEDAERFGQIDVVEAAAARPQPRFAIAIVRGALLRIAQHVVRLRDLLEPLLGFLRAVVAVRVIRHRELAICLLDVVVGRRSLNAEDAVEIRHCVSDQSRRSLSSRDVWLTSEMTFSYGMRVGPITPMTPASGPT